MTWQNELQAITSKVKYNEPLSKHTSFLIGGPALALVEVNSVDKLKSLLSFRERFNLPAMVIGRGTNILIGDAGYNGIIVVLSALPPLEKGGRGDFSQIQFNGTQIIAGAGITLTRLAKQLAQNSLSGLEFAYGIPGTLGGALIMNAGAHGHSMSEIVTEVQIMTHKSEVLTISNEQAGFDYRHSNLGQYFCILEATLQFKRKSREKIEAEMRKLYDERKSKQPLSFPSAGCIFKNPPGTSAGKLIDECGLKGTKIGGAEVSQKHANFIINSSDATATDVLTLIDLVRKQVKSKTGIELELEIQQVNIDKNDTEYSP